ncbi:MAG: hypothetical protein WBJ03_14080 [Moraxellaceae bacterium]
MRIIGAYVDCRVVRVVRVVIGVTVALVAARRAQQSLPVVKQ